MDYTNCAKEILKEIGGRENIKDLTHCVTRLRFVLKDETKVDDEKVKAIKGVMGVMKKGGQYQVIIGNDVNKCYNIVLSLTGMNGETSNMITEEKEPLTVKGVVNRILDIVSGSMSAIMMPLIGCGMIKLLIIILGLVGVSDTNTTYKILVAIGDSCFYFLPVLLAYTSSKKFGTNPMMAACVVAVLIHPDIIGLLSGEEVVTFLGIKVTSGSYASSVIPALLSTWLLSYVEKIVDRFTPVWAKNIFKPMFILLITVPIVLIVLAPAGNIVGLGLETAMSWCQQRAGWLTLAVFSAIMPFVVMTGMHWAFVPTAITTLATAGAGEGMLIPAMLASNLAQGAACMAVSLKSKNKELKSVSIAAGVSALVAGITEPGLYGVTLRLKKPLIACCIGSGLSGLFIGIFGVLSYGPAVPSLISIIEFIAPNGGNNFMYACIAATIAIVVTFIMTLVLGFEDPKEVQEVKIEEMNENIDEIEKMVYAPMKGRVIPLKDVPDETFASEILGKGMAIIPAEGKVYAPFDGTVISVFNTLHAYGLRSNDGVEVLIHIGLETVRLNGEGFTAYVKQGDTIKRGDLLAEMDLERIKQAGYEIVTPILVSNIEMFHDIIEIKKQEKVEQGEPLLMLL